MSGVQGVERGRDINSQGQLRGEQLSKSPRGGVEKEPWAFQCLARSTVAVLGTGSLCQPEAVRSCKNTKGLESPGEVTFLPRRQEYCRPSAVWPSLAPSAQTLHPYQLNIIN